METSNKHLIEQLEPEVLTNATVVMSGVSSRVA